MTVNTILYDEEIDNVRRLLQELQKIGVDAILVQDIVETVAGSRTRTEAGGSDIDGVGTMVDGRDATR